MPSRETLHELVDKLPEPAFEMTERMLKNYQTWPPKPPMTVEKMRRRVDEMRRNQTQESGVTRGKGLIRGYSGSGGTDPSGDGTSSMTTMDDSDVVNFEVRIFRGHRLEIEERLYLSDDGKLLRYSQQISGPDGKTDHYEVDFKVPGGPSARGA